MTSMIHLLLDVLMILLCSAAIVAAFCGRYSLVELLVVAIYLPCAAYSLFTGKWRRDSNGRPLVIHSSSDPKETKA